MAAGASSLLPGNLALSSSSSSSLSLSLSGFSQPFTPLPQQKYIFPGCVKMQTGFPSLFSAGARNIIIAEIRKRIRAASRKPAA